MTFEDKYKTFKIKIPETVFIFPTATNPKQ